MKTFKSLVYELDETGEVSSIIKTNTLENLDAGEVVIRVAYSSVNYKDALAAVNSRSGVIRHYPLIGGIDLSGEVISSEDKRFQKGDQVVVTGYDLGVSHHGGYSQVARVPAQWVIKLPDTLTLKEAMILGTAGLTAALSINALLQHGLADNKQAPVLITGASGGVGSLAVGMLKKLGYENLTVLTRKKITSKEYFDRLGVNQIFSPEEMTPEHLRPLMTQ
ncbi:alcohol dehydrogenase catalytic domain-containing protein [Vagococcus elongatus]|uniref:alcohol dehydrogenase catalytic domain-containing protein n=1 Tax=Vagococcus elongatus TaxID=180344 RepID=UPI001B87C0F0|nr:alcohol dehydrogenase catalytic domain-containing protein [Vagococcus elongatus]